MCYLARDLPERFSNGKVVMVAMISNMQIFIVAVPVLIILGSEPQTSFFVRSVAIWMNDLVVVSLVFGNLFFKVQDFDQKALRSSRRMNSQITLHSDIRNYAKQVRDKRSSLDSKASAGSASKYTTDFSSYLGSYSNSMELNSSVGTAIGGRRPSQLNVVVEALREDSGPMSNNGDDDDDIDSDLSKESTSSNEDLPKREAAPITEETFRSSMNSHLEDSSNHDNTAAQSPEENQDSPIIPTSMESIKAIEKNTHEDFSLRESLALEHLVPMPPEVSPNPTEELSEDVKA